MSPVLKCICCEKELQPVTVDEDCYQPFDGLVCETFGNYGSTVFDPIEPEYRGSCLMFFLCDSCLTVKKNIVYFVEVAKDAEPVPATNFLDS